MKLVLLVVKQERKGETAKLDVNEIAGLWLSVKVYESLAGFPPQPN